MFTALLGWIPIIGPIIQGITSIFNKRQDVVIQKIKTEGEVTIQETQSSAQIIRDTSDDIGVRLARDLLLFPTIIWMDLIVWDKIMVTRHPELVWTVLPLPEIVAYMPFAVATFLLGNIGLNMWKRR